MKRTIIIALAALLCISVEAIACLAFVLHDPGPNYHLSENQLDAILKESEQLANDKSLPEAYGVDRANWPPVIASLAPQFVDTHRNEGANHVDIQLSGGFYHFGLFVICVPAPPDFAPSESNFRVQRLTPRIFTYRE